jgi:quinoprotein glucose dehydrogenase
MNRSFRAVSAAISFTILGLVLNACGPRPPQPLDASASMSGADWPWYHGNPHGTHYSTLDQITPQNVADLKVAWTFDSGDAFGEGDNQSDMQSNPMIVRGRLYFVSPKGRLFCLDAATGRQAWVFDPAFGETIATRQRLRGMSYWSDGEDERILFTFRGKLMAVDAKTGKLVDTLATMARLICAKASAGPKTASMSAMSRPAWSIRI